MITLSKDQLRTLFEVIEELVDYAGSNSDLVPDLSDIQSDLNSVFSEEEYNPNAYNEFKDLVELKYEPEGYLSLSNFGGISIMLDPEDNDYLYYKYYTNKPVRARIYYVNTEEDQSEPVFDFGTDEVFRLDDFIRVNYPENK